MKERTFWFANVNFIKDHTYSDNVFEVGFRKIFNSVAEIFAIYPNVYNLLRIFKTFNITKIMIKMVKR